MKEKNYYGAQDISEMLGISVSSAYTIIRDLNSELQKKNYYTIRGKVSKIYFHEKLYGSKEVG